MLVYPNNLIILNSKEEQTFDTHNNFDKFHRHYAEGKKDRTEDYLRNTSVTWHSRKDKIVVLEDTLVVARGNGWGEGVNIIE